jgi:mono/diheme cytochrome c family protein
VRRSRALVRGLALAATLAGAALLGVGCGTGGLASSKADVAHGKQLFVQKCGSCHTLADAGTQGKVGPNLDDAFSGPRQQGFKESSIRNIVHDQILFAISHPSGVIKGPNGQLQPVAGMPQKLVTGQDAQDVAAYVASVAGVSAAGVSAAGGTATQTQTTAAPATSTTATTSTTAAGAGAGGAVAQGKAVFQQAGCGSCHTLKDAGASGTVGPNLDQKKPPKARVVKQVTNGGKIMPPFKGRLTPAQIEAVATYVSSVAGKSGK